jgi:demethylmenaquinone methyltransferase/2-methoxy-6-polyprenyl-1,4-benzoquinol methylase
MSEKHTDNTAVESINPYNDGGAKTGQVREMFNSIAPAYDFMNRAMSFGIHRHWLKRAVKMVKADNPTSILDVATGTADVAIALAKRIDNTTITGIDLSQGMIDIGRRKIQSANLADRINLAVADCLALPFADASFDAVTVAYGVRNFEHLLEGYREMLRVLRPGGTITVIELSTPTSPIVKPFYKLYTRHIIPLIGRLVSHDVRAYSYLPESIAAVPQATAMTDLMARAGFNNPTYHRMTLGTCTIYRASKL